MAQKDVYELFHLFYINYMGPVYELLHKHPLERDIIHADETPCQVLKEDGKPAQSNAHPLFHSDRGFQYTSQAFYSRLKKHHMKQSMSRVAHCIDNGQMERFWGILKREMYYGKYFISKEELIQSIQDYIDYYNNRRLQRKLQVA